MTKPTNPTKDGYTFSGWYLNNKVYDFDSSVTKNITLVAKWTKNNVAKETYTVKFDSNGGSSVSSQKIEENKKATKPSNPTKDGYTFLGWYTDNKSQYDFSKSVTSNVNLFALWAPILKYNLNSNGKWIFVNNPENLISDNYLADKDYGNNLLYKTSFSGTAELYYEHGLDYNYRNKFYYAVRIYNPNTTSVTLKINKCGATIGWDATKIWKQYYYGTCSLAGKTYTIPARKNAIIYHNDNSYLYGVNGDQSKVSKISSDAFEGVINMTVSNKVYIANLIFKNIENTYEATYTGNYTKNIGNSTTSRVYSGEYTKLPILTNNMTYEIYDQTPSGILPISYVATDNNTYISDNNYTWNTHSVGGTIDTNNGYTPVYKKSQYVGDIIKLKVPTESGEFTIGPYKEYSEKRNLYHAIANVSMIGWPYNWGNWAVHYQENITIKNNSNTNKTITFKLIGLSSSQTVNVLYDGKIVGYKKNGDQNIWTVTIPAKSSKKVSTNILLGGHSRGNIARELYLK